MRYSTISPRRKRRQTGESGCCRQRVGFARCCCGTSTAPESWPGGAAILEYFTVGRTVDELFDDEIRLILRG